MIEVIHTTAFVVFFALLVVGATSTIARVVFYRTHGFRRPRLLVRDAAMLGGFAASFGMILVARAFDLPVELRDNPLWAIGTDAPAVLAVLVYVYFEVFVIERGRDEAGDWTALRERPPEA